MSAITTINTIEDSVAKYSPLAVSTVIAIENAAANVDGKTKFQIAMNILQAAASGVQNAPQPTVAAFGGLINVFVALFNAMGTFVHKPLAAAPLSH